jgi:hypothetical protein
MDTAISMPISGYFGPSCPLIPVYRAQFDGLTGMTGHDTGIGGHDTGMAGHDTETVSWQVLSH